MPKLLTKTLQRYINTFLLEFFNNDPLALDNQK